MTDILLFYFKFFYAGLQRIQGINLSALYSLRSLCEIKTSYAISKF